MSARLPLFAMRALMNFMHRRNGWSFHILAEDQRTVLVSECTAGKRETLLSIIARLQGNVVEAKHVIQFGNQGSVWIEISQAQIAALRAHTRRHSTANRDRASSE